MDEVYKKIYYNISEVSRITGIKPYVLRYWETEFPELKPIKDRANRRLYRKREIELIFLLKKMLYEDKYTIKGAKKKIAEIVRGTSGESSGTLSPAILTIEELLHSLDENMGEVKRLLEKL